MYLAHIPVNHHLRPLYRAIAGLCGLSLVAVGIYGLVEMSGLELFASEGLPEIWGMRFNPFAAGMFLVFGIGIVAVTALGRNIDHLGNFWMGQLLVIIALLSLALLRTDANLLGFNIDADLYTMIVGLVVWTSSLYVKVGPKRPQDGEHQDTRDLRHPPAHV